MLQQDEPGDYVFATGQSHSVRELCERAFARGGFELGWEGRGLDEVGRDRRSGRPLVRVDRTYLRLTEVDRLEGNASRARARLGWTPTVSFEGLVDMMVDADLALAAREARIK